MSSAAGFGCEPGQEQALVRQVLREFGSRTEKIRQGLMQEPGNALGDWSAHIDVRALPPPGHDIAQLARP